MTFKKARILTNRQIHQTRDHKLLWLKKIFKKNLAQHSACRFLHRRHVVCVVRACVGVCGGCVVDVGVCVMCGVCVMWCVSGVCGVCVCGV